MKLGISGALTRTFIGSPLTPLLLMASLLVGLLALQALPREEEPQISVPLVDIIVPTNGYKAEDAIELVTRPLEDLIKSINGVEHVYSQTQDDNVVVTARYFVGTPQDNAVLRVHDKIRANITGLPKGIGEPLIIGRGIDDVAIVVLTLSAKPERAANWNANGLFQVAEELRHELSKVDNIGLTYIVGGSPNQIRVEPDPERLSAFGITLNQLVDKLTNANRSLVVGAFRGNDKSISVVAGQTLQGVPDIGQLLLTSRDGRPIYVKDVATVRVGEAQPEHFAWTFTRGEKGEGAKGEGAKGELEKRPAVSLAIAKRKGANAVVLAEEILHRLEITKGRIVPGDLDVEVTRNYGETASEKANELLFHLALATLSIVALIIFLVGWREGVVVFVIIPTTILLTLFASYMMGYTINRVSLFALIFSIGILVDDAIVVVENIVRHWEMRGDRGLTETAIEAVAEVGNPTIVATLTIVAALLPMLFVSGLMGPYMSPIPANASLAMVFSFFVAMTITPWLLMMIARSRFEKMEAHEHLGPENLEPDPGVMGRFYKGVASRLLKGRENSKRFLLFVGLATLAALGLFVTKSVRVKLLPFDNKSEIAVVVDLPRGASLEATDRLLTAAAERLKDLPELTSIQSYAGTAAPFNFNGLVRHYYLRNAPNMGDLAVNLLSKDERKRASHAIALDIRKRLDGLERPARTSIKVVEVPPGPPVLSTLLAEIYGPTAEARREIATRVRQAFEAVDFIVDVDDSFGVRQERLRYSIDQESLEFHGVEQQAVYDTIAALVGGVKIGYSQRGGGAKPVDITVALPRSAMAENERILSTPLPAGGTVRQGANVELGDVVRVTRELSSYPIFRRDGRFAEMITGELAGRFEAPIYGMFAVEDQIKAMDWGKEGPPTIKYHGQPLDDSKPTLLWDGEWEVTYVTFRDMGAAFMVALLGIYLLVVAQFGSFKLPLVILAPVPLTLVGIMFGHWIFGAAFTATSMIGFIALAGIVVRNSILLVDFIRHLREKGMPLRAALIEAGAVRFKPIFLTAAAAIIGAAFILTDPIFQGLAISLVFGLASSTALTLLVIPAIYVVLRDDELPPPGKEDKPWFKFRIGRS
ncbi:efflux RND transporter permease subunit [Methylocystis bryophila]|uniref:Multidrug transporter AcrB n=1 Tax=Methylocystis bryophila TaxID=655015 RepID=A0A1W6MSH7_9HYPH|nr:efflux RND transporter permease subunit [Methylocystis bryophila]ARN80512.1 multidrug transporter AcrB [Methylocystis bryophila]BDV40550.1 multidrug transporter AcrB [Methylocystis bryophila]